MSSRRKRRAVAEAARHEAMESDERSSWSPRDCERSDDYYIGLYSGLSADGDSGGYGMQEL